MPQLGVKVDGVPGRLNQFLTVIGHPGFFYGQCSELCGVGHGFMPIKVLAVPFDVWKDQFDVSYTIDKHHSSIYNEDFKLLMDCFEDIMKNKLVGLKLKNDFNLLISWMFFEFSMIWRLRLSSFSQFVFTYIVNVSNFFFK